ncbi:MAG: hypothetical protein H0T39_00100 [Actinobacteria bacterium]|nr:hypothetical protein [Actinomycetota bacterium]
MSSWADSLRRHAVERLGVDGAAAAITGTLARRIGEEWAHVVDVLSLERGSGWEAELPDDLQVARLGDPDFPDAVLFDFRDVDLAYLVVPADDAVIEYTMPDDPDDDAVARVYVRSGELLREKTVNVADLLAAVEGS